jgi:hypothetical protein
LPGKRVEAQRAGMMTAALDMTRTSCSGAQGACKQ